MHSNKFLNCNKNKFLTRQIIKECNYESAEDFFFLLLFESTSIKTNFKNTYFLIKSYSMFTVQFVLAKLENKKNNTKISQNTLYLLYIV